MTNIVTTSAAKSEVTERPERIINPNWLTLCQGYLRFLVTLRGAGSSLTDADRMFLMAAGQHHGVYIRDVVRTLDNGDCPVEKAIAQTMLEYGVYS